MPNRSDWVLVGHVMHLFLCIVVYSLGIWAYTVNVKFFTCLRLLWESSQLVNKISVCCATRSFFAVGTRAYLWVLSSLGLIQATFPHLLEKCVLIVLYHLLLALRGECFWNISEIFREPLLQCAYTVTASCHGQMSKSPDFYLWSPGLESRLEAWLSWLQFVGVFVDYCWEISWYCLKQATTASTSLPIHYSLIIDNLCCWQRR